MLTFNKLSEELKNSLLNQKPLTNKNMELAIAKLPATEPHLLENIRYELKEQIANQLSFDEYAYIIALPNPKHHPLYEVLGNPEFQEKRRWEYCSNYVEKYLDQQKAFLYFVHPDFYGDFVTGLNLLISTYFKIYAAENLFREKARDTENFVKLKRNAANLLFYVLLNGSSDNYSFIYNQIREKNFLYPVDHRRRLGDRYVEHLNFIHQRKPSLKIEFHTYSLLVYWMAIITKNFDKIRTILDNSTLCRELIKPDQDIGECVQTYDDFHTVTSNKLFLNSPYYKGILEHFDFPMTIFQIALLAAIKGATHSDVVKKMIDDMNLNGISQNMKPGHYWDSITNLRILSLILTRINPDEPVNPDSAILYSTLRTACFSSLNHLKADDPKDVEFLNKALPSLDSLLLYAIASRSVEKTNEILEIFAKYNVEPAQRTRLSTLFFPNFRRMHMKKTGALRKQFFSKCVKEIPIETKTIQAKIILLLLDKNINIIFYQCTYQKGLMGQIIQDPFYCQQLDLVDKALALTQQDHQIKKTSEATLQKELITLLYALMDNKVNKVLDELYLTIISKLVKSYGINCGISEKEQTVAIQALFNLDNNTISEETIKQIFHFNSTNPDQQSFEAARALGFHAKKQKCEENKESPSEEIISINQEIGEEQNDDEIEKLSIKQSGNNQSDTEDGFGELHAYDTNPPYIRLK